MINSHPENYMSWKCLAIFQVVHAGNCERWDFSRLEIICGGFARLGNVWGSYIVQKPGLFGLVTTETWPTWTSNQREGETWRICTCYHRYLLFIRTQMNVTHPTDCWLISKKNEHQQKNNTSKNEYQQKWTPAKMNNSKKKGRGFNYF